ncbi:MAG: enoyl-CoA hydratase-related protein [Deltaproteobacteria bacterium]|nr:enoyl-CoA hydratase-related protein [Deltaproteobacteria bacterium]
MRLDRKFNDILFETIQAKPNQFVAKIAINRPHRLNSWTSDTIDELIEAFRFVQNEKKIRVIILGSSCDEAFSTGGDVKERGNTGYKSTLSGEKVNVLELYDLIRYIPQPVIAVVKGYAIGGGQILQLCCDLTVAADNAIFGQNGPRVGSFDGGYGSHLLALTVGVKRAKDLWFTLKRLNAYEALNWGLVNYVVPLAECDDYAIELARKIIDLSPTSIKFLKYSINALIDGSYGFTHFAHATTSLFYGTEESKEGRDAFKEKRDPDFSKF